MYFLLQYNDREFKDVEMHIVKNLLDEKSRIHDYKCLTYDEIESVLEDMSIPIKEAVPIGSIKFVQKFLRDVHGIDNMNCIEVPDELRKPEYLKRGYSILKREDLPSSGYYFLKYASKLKDFSYLGNIEFLPSEDLGNNEPYLKDGLYVLSEAVEILSEYRCFIFEDVIEGIQFYDGDCTVMPTKEDIQLLKKMVEAYKSNESRPRAYTLDVAIIKDRGLAVIECHPHVSIGLYGFNTGSLLYNYVYGFDWYISSNSTLTTFHGM